MKKAALLDRDGVINQKLPEGRYVTRWDELKFLPGVEEAIALLCQAGFRVVVVTNQRSVAKGLITCENLEAMHARMCERFAAAGAVIDAVYYCPHDYEAGCACRKPAPGLLIQAAEEHQLDLATSWMIGDSDIDVMAGRSAGCRTALIADAAENGDARADVEATSLLDAVRRILQLAHGETDSTDQFATLASSMGD